LTGIDDTRCNQAHRCDERRCQRKEAIMPRLPTVAVEDAKGKVRGIYSHIAVTEGEPHLLLRCFANDPEVLRVEWELEKELMYGDSLLSRRLREYISLTVAMLQDCGG
jgi:hypothetical protein